MLIIELVVFNLIWCRFHFVTIFDRAKIRYSIELPNQTMKTFSLFYEKKSTVIVYNLVNN